MSLHVNPVFVALATPAAHVAVAKMMERQHETNPFGWHHRHPTVKKCPYDEACTALPGRSS